MENEMNHRNLLLFWCWMEVIQSYKVFQVIDFNNISTCLGLFYA